METVPAMADEPQDLMGHQVKPQKSDGERPKFAVRRGSLENKNIG